MIYTTHKATRKREERKKIDCRHACKTERKKRSNKAPPPQHTYHARESERKLKRISPRQWKENAKRSSLRLRAESFC